MYLYPHIYQLLGKNFAFHHISSIEIQGIKAAAYTITVVDLLAVTSGHFTCRPSNPKVFISHTILH